MQYPLPQFIEKEGRIISFLTFKQFFLLVGGGAACFIMFLLLPLYFFIIGAILVALIVVIIAFVKVDNTSIITIVLNLLGFMVASKNYTWQKKSHPYPFKAPPPKAPIKKEELQAAPKSAPLTSQVSRIGQAKKMIDTKR